MRILLTGATGYIGKRLLTTLLESGHEVVCCVRNKNRLPILPAYKDQVTVFECDFSKPVIPDNDLPEVDTAYFLVHSLANATGGYANSEHDMAMNFRNLATTLKCKQVVYLGGIANEDALSEHLSSRKAVESVLQDGPFACTVLRAAIIVGSGSASFEIIRDLVEKLPIMITPKWINTECQPIAVRNVIEYLTAVMGNEATYNQTYDIGGPEILTYKEMMLGYAKVRSLKRFIYAVPVMTPRLSSYWLYFITSTNYKLAVNLVNSMKIRVVCSENRLQDLLQIKLTPYQDAVSLAFDKIEQSMVLSSWTSALSSSGTEEDWQAHIQVPEHGCLTDSRKIPIPASIDAVKKKLYSIGGKQGWYYANFLWRIRGFMDRLMGGVGLRRGRANNSELDPGDALDFWRVLATDPKKERLLLYAEMKLPGEAWLEFNISEDGKFLSQTATFRPRGLSGRMYWYLVSPLHYFVFQGMAEKIAQG